MMCSFWSQHLSLCSELCFNWLFNWTTIQFCLHIIVLSMMGSLNIFDCIKDHELTIRPIFFCTPIAIYGNTKTNAFGPMNDCRSIIYANNGEHRKSPHEFPVNYRCTWIQYAPDEASIWSCTCVHCTLHAWLHRQMTTYLTMFTIIITWARLFAWLSGWQRIGINLALKVIASSQVNRLMHKKLWKIEKRMVVMNHHSCKMLYTPPIFEEKNNITTGGLCPTIAAN